ncbi:phosphopantetheine-binding protein, partial [Lacrimispora sp.]|uniref:phosphopantetheine-binding protein n=1 Tax=Lacrimispora sp. TaxID=2719234 RepID=UPI0028AC5923
EPEYQKPEGYVAPRNSVEEAVVAAFKEVLGVEQAGIYDDFYELGGHSLKATMLIMVLKDLLSIKISLRTVFLYSSVEKLALRIGELMKENKNTDSMMSHDLDNIEDEVLV